ncbi:Threonine-phosphate decarboxylase [Tritonibacter multivorans]|uniref:threonine-phosphate decarboxylase n=1 Tax=Tritonibacter multivorans TaxID=928856 RepID=A0A0P1GCD2_9RHOB|nr:threonine-phosphate decarboxylase CobD [Tritonibacter multivorans]MDA7421345.1 threonine-phosphate decarboxylase CobD [Tritonibacter multivorans]CUH78964.1 Threonine-phosphate decarboxylase [Tritonibacter multivorans]SFD26981.1 L-threonine O-3-phosphate decarboxylase [Tritonibacter multivorans]
MTEEAKRDHGGNLFAAMSTYGGPRNAWLDLSTGINPAPYPLPAFADKDWAALPDADAHSALISAARAFWSVPQDAAVLAAPGASSLIAKIPTLAPMGQVDIPQPTYNEHAAAFAYHGWTQTSDTAQARVLVHPNNPDGRLWQAQDLDLPLMVIDESFCDVTPEASLIAAAARPGVIVLKSFGKFWGLAGLRLGFAIGDPALIDALSAQLGPWPVSGPALRVGTAALQDHSWAAQARKQLSQEAARLDQLALSRGAQLVGGTDLFRLYEVDDAAKWQDKLARHHVWSRIFPYSKTYLRLGLPPRDRWDQLEEAFS